MPPSCPLCSAIFSSRKSTSSTMSAIREKRERSFLDNNELLSLPIPGEHICSTWWMTSLSGRGQRATLHMNVSTVSHGHAEWPAKSAGFARRPRADMKPERYVLAGSGAVGSSLIVRVARSVRVARRGRSFRSNTSPESMIGRMGEYFSARISRASVRMGVEDGVYLVRG